MQGKGVGGHLIRATMQRAASMGFAGVVITVIPMVVGYLFAKKVCKLPLLSNLGSITGGMTSTPALGTLIHVTGTEDVASAYAATYPIALIAVVLVSQLLILCF